MENYQEAIVKIANAQFNKLKSAGKIRVNKKNFEREELPHGLFLTAR